MTLHNRIILAVILTMFSFSGFSANNLPDGWMQGGTNLINYKLGVDKAGGFHGESSAFIESTSKSPEGFSTMMQDAGVTEYLGKRVQMTVYIRSNKVADWSGAWLRIDGGDRAKPLAFDNMVNRSIKGTTDWQPYNIVVDVPEDAKRMVFGVLLNGAGKVWFDDFNFKVVDNNIPVTSMELN